MKPITLYLCIVCLVLFSGRCFAKDQDWQKILADGYHELQVGNTDHSVAIFSSKVRKYPESAACRTALGRALKRLGKIDEAKAEFKQATLLDQNFPDGFYELGVVEESDKHWPEAIAAFNKYLQLKPAASERQALSDRIRFCEDHMSEALSHKSQ